MTMTKEGQAMARPKPVSILQHRGLPLEARRREPKKAVRRHATPAYAVKPRKPLHFEARLPVAVKSLLSSPATIVAPAAPVEVPQACPVTPSKVDSTRTLRQRVMSLLTNRQTKCVALGVVSGLAAAFSPLSPLLGAAVIVRTLASVAVGFCATAGAWTLGEKNSATKAVAVGLGSVGGALAGAALASAICPPLAPIFAVVGAAVGALGAAQIVKRMKDLWIWIALFGVLVVGLGAYWLSRSWPSLIQDRGPTGPGKG